MNVHRYSIEKQKHSHVLENIAGCTQTKNKNHSVSKNKNEEE